MAIYNCPFCHASTEDGIDFLVEHRKPGGECDQRLAEMEETQVEEPS